MRVFVTGGTGAIGVHTVPALVAAGHAVTALARSDAKAGVLRSQGAEPISVSLFDRRGLADAFAGHDAVVNLASAVLAFSLDLTVAERGLILALGLLVLAAELMNTGLEEVVDYISKAEDPRAKKAKDCGSAAVALTAIAGGVAWVVVLIG